MDEGIERLPEELRTVFVLRDIEELSNAEVARDPRACRWRR